MDGEDPSVAEACLSRRPHRRAFLGRMCPTSVWTSLWQLASRSSLRATSQRLPGGHSPARSCLRAMLESESAEVLSKQVAESRSMRFESMPAHQNSASEGSVLEHAGASVAGAEAAHSSHDSEAPSPVKVRARRAPTSGPCTSRDLGAATRDPTVDLILAVALKRWGRSEMDEGLRPPNLWPELASQGAQLNRRHRHRFPQRSRCLRLSAGRAEPGRVG